MTTWENEPGSKTRGASAIIWLTGAVLVTFLVWAAFASLDEIVKAEGVVVSGDRPQIIQNLEGGILAELLVGEGDIVVPGQVLARLRDTRFQAAVSDLQGRIAAAEIRRLRLEAEIDGQAEFLVPAAMARTVPEIVASEQALLVARQGDYTARVDGAARMLAETRRELETMEDLYAREIAALIEVTRARKANGDAESRHDEIVTGAELERANAYSEVLQDLATLHQELALAQDQLSRTVIVAPMAGVVNNLGVTTIGGVIRPGEEIFQIIPLGDALFVEARVRPADIANLVTGQRATIKLSAYDHTVYGALTGVVTFISADTFPDERRADLPPHYKVTVAVDLTGLTGRQTEIEIRPGMQAAVELHTGQKTVLDYLTKPLYRGSEALREP